MARGFKTGGRVKGTPNKATAELRKYAQQYDRPMIDVLTNIALGVKVGDKGKNVPHEYDDRARVVAARTVLEFGHGKPPQAITGPDGEPIVVPSSVTFVIKKAESGQH
jgi:hypothetical protein